MFKPKVYADLMRAGMCNRLFPWAYAVIYSELNHTPYHINGWYKTQIGPWLRGERVKRFYALYFKDEADLPGYFLRRFFSKNNILYNPSLVTNWDKAKYHTVIFNSIPNSSVYFDELQGYAELLSDRLQAMIAKKIKKQINHLSAPEIGVHIRRGDFSKGSDLEGEQYFIDAIHFIRSEFGSSLKVTIFTDGFGHEINSILQLPDTTIHYGKSDIEDLILLSKSRYIITSHSSTFSYWAAFLSKAVIVHSHKYNNRPLRWSGFVDLKGLRFELPPEVNFLEHV